MSIQMERKIIYALIYIFNIENNTWYLRVEYLE